MPILWQLVCVHGRPSYFDAVLSLFRPPSSVTELGELAKQTLSHVGKWHRSKNGGPKTCLV